MADLARPQVTMDARALAAVEEHCFSRVDVEVGGFLIGTVDGLAVTVTGAKPALTAESNQTHLTFTHEAWAEVLDVLATEFPGSEIVGWYHSHPGFGCFLSEYDVFIQENFFSGPGQHALVVDPIAGKYATFIAADGKAVELESGDTRTKGVGGEGIDKVDLVEGQAAAGQGRGRSWVAPVVAAVVTAVLVGSAAWFTGTVQGQDDGRRSADAQLQAARGQVATLQVQVDTLAQIPPSTPLASASGGPSTEPATVSTQTPGQLPLEVGDQAVFVLEHVVEPGDSLWALAERYLGSGLRYREILKINPEVRQQGLQPGQVVGIVVTGRLKALAEGGN